MDVEDRGSSNGTLVNASRITGPSCCATATCPRSADPVDLPCRDGEDELRRTTPALGPRRARAITESQRKVLVELCRPAIERGGGAASNREIAEALFVSVETVKTHMRALFDAFAVGDVPQYHKRSELVRRALETGPRERPRHLAAARLPRASGAATISVSPTEI